MDDEPQAAVTGQQGEDPLDIMATAAAGAARAKRKAANVSGIHVCWVAGCDCKDDLVGVAPGRAADAMHIMQGQMGIDLGEYNGKPRTLPDRDDRNQLCPSHIPSLPRQQIIGAKVLWKVDGVHIPATVIGPEIVVGGAGRGPRAARDLAAPILPETRWRVQGDADLDGHIDATTAEVWAAADLRASYDASLRAAEAEAKKKYQGKVDALQHKVARAKAKVMKPQPPPVPRSSPPSPRRAPAPPPPPPPPAATVARVKVRIPLERSWKPGEPVALVVPAGYVESPQRSRAVTLLKQPPPNSIPGSFVSFDVELPLDPPPRPPMLVEKSGRKSADARRYISARAEQLGLAYSAEPNPLQRKRAWPLREQLTFANLRPEYFQLPDRCKLFKKLFGFECWEDAMVVYEQIYEWDSDAHARRKREAAAIIHPRFQYLAALWRMRQHKDCDELAAFFGVRQQFISDHVPRWIRRMGRFAKANLVFMPKDFESITEMMPQAFLDCGLGSVVAIGDCTDILTEDSRENKYVSNQSRSDKSKHRPPWD